MSEDVYRKNWMTAGQWECVKFLRDFFRGWHHMDPHRIKNAGPHGIEYNASAAAMKLATFDFNGLTRLVILAHDRCIRVDVEPSGPQMLKMFLHHRTREGLVHERHPTLEEAIADFGPREVWMP